MERTYILEPEVPGGLGVRTQMDRSVHPPKVTVLHVVFDGWLGDQLVEIFPCYLVTEPMEAALANAGVSGFELVDVAIETSEFFREMYPGRQLPPFKWLKVLGKPGRSDLFMTADHRLAVSQRVLELVLVTNPRGLHHREVES